MQAKAWLLGRTVSAVPLPKHLQMRLCRAPGWLENQPCSCLWRAGVRLVRACTAPGITLRGAPTGSLERRETGRIGESGRRKEGLFTCSRRKSWGLKSFGEHPHQSTMCLYWHLQPSFRFQLVTRRLLSTSVSQAWLFSRTVWKKDCSWQRRDRTAGGDGGCRG